MKQYIPVFFCILIGTALSIWFFVNTEPKHINTYPNLPAPIAEEKILITSAGQAAEATILSSIAENLNLEADYRPIALATDLYDYKSVVIMLGYSANGQSNTIRSFQEERDRITSLLKEAGKTKLPIVVVDPTGIHRNDKQSWRLFENIAPFADYFIGLKNMNDTEKAIQLLNKHSVPVTLVSDLEDIKIPFNSVYR
ncbi:DUF6305 family protein [Virgibacillus kekensis]|uniref:DUF6305 family protein n=1 Tax=Virgibacillus kekensis TaxID=202261 RepID=A0ABV9DF92_9BACI